VRVTSSKLTIRTILLEGWAGQVCARITSYDVTADEQIAIMKLSDVALNNNVSNFRKTGAFEKKAKAKRIKEQYKTMVRNARIR